MISNRFSFRTYGAFERESLTKSFTSLSNEIDKLLEEIDTIENSMEENDTPSAKLSSKKKRRLDYVNTLFNKTKELLVNLVLTFN